jgi:hypothetical protein
MCMARCVSRGRGLASHAHSMVTIRDLLTLTSSPIQVMILLISSMFLNAHVFYKLAESISLINTDMHVATCCNCPFKMPVAIMKE